MTTPADETTHRELASWTHLWMSADAQTLEQLDSGLDDQDPVGSIVAKDALSLVLVSAVHNVYRGALAVLPRGIRT